MAIKTTGDHYAAVESAIRRIHRYELPEVVAVSIIHGLPAFLDWIEGETHVDGSGP